MNKCEISYRELFLSCLCTISTQASCRKQGHDAEAEGECEGECEYFIDSI